MLLVDEIIEKQIIGEKFIWFTIPTPPSPTRHPLRVLTHDTPVEK
jgi:hypothetical protein